MADPNIVNIKGLPRVEEIVDGNFLIVENERGTNTLDFVNFVIGPNNTSFYSQITNLSSALVSLSASCTSLVLDLSSSTNAQILAVNTRITSLSSTVTNTISGMYYQTGNVDVSVGSRTSSLITIIKPTSLLLLDADDITLTLGSSAFPPTIPYMDAGDVTNAGTTTQFSVRLTNNATISAVKVRYKVFKPYTI